jgi:hypothetical protein
MDVRNESERDITLELVLQLNEKFMNFNWKYLAKGF